MTKQQLAAELRQHQYKLGHVPRRLIDLLPDRQIIKAYATCNECGEDLLSPESLKVAISTANSAEEFLQAVSDESARHEA